MQFFMVFAISVTAKPFQHNHLTLTIPGHMAHYCISYFANCSKWLPHNSVMEFSAM